MPLSRYASWAFCGALLVVLLAGALPAQAGKALDRHYPINKWCSIVSGFTSAADLTTPYVFVTPAGHTRVMITLTATNVTGDQWSNQRLDDFVVLPTANLPTGTEPFCFDQQLSGALAARPPAYPGVGVASLFRDDFQTGAKPEWGTIPSETLPPDGNAPASVYWTAVGSQPATEVLYRGFDDGQADLFTLSTVTGQNLWRATTDCGPAAFGAGQLAFTGTTGCTYPDGAYDVSIVSPALDLTGATSATLQYRHRWNTAQDGTCSVETSLNGSSWTSLDSTSGFSGWVNKGQFLQTGVGTSAFKIRFRFTATNGSGEGCFFDDVSVLTSSSATPNGALALGRSLHVNDDPGEPFIDVAPVVARLNLTGLTPNTSYAVMARWNSAAGSNNVPEPDPTRLIVNHVFDPLLSSPTHTPSVWSRTAQITIQWSGAVSTDENNIPNLAGYSTAFDTSATTSPDTTVDTVQGTDPHSFTSGVLADGGNYYFHLRTCDTAQNCTAANHFGPFQIDRTAPTAPTTVSSTSHAVGVTSFDRTIDMSWSGATDALSGVDGYGFVFDNNTTWTCDQVKNVEEGVTTTTSATLAAGTWYFHVCTRDNAGNWSGSATAGPYTIAVDTTAPTNPTLSSTTHTVNVWSSSRSVTIRWSGSTDAGGSGVAGYSTALDSAAATSPDTTIETPQTTDPHSFTSPSLADGGNYYFHLRACDLALNCSTAVHIGPFRIDGTAPTTPTNLTSSSHTVGVPSTDTTIDVSWTASTDVSSGVDGYGFAFDNSATWTCDQVKDVEEGVTATTSASLAMGTWYFHVCTRDNAGNWSGSATAGPYTIAADTTAPTNPTLSSTTHTVNVWSSVRQVTIRWSGSTDAGGSGVAGYSTVFDSAATTSPDTSIETPHTTDPHSFTSASLADGGNYYFHLRACDVALNCSTAVHLGPFRIDGTAPTTPTHLTSSSHTVGTPSTDPTIDVSWTASTDASSGVDGYSYAFDSIPTWTCDQTKDVEEGIASATSTALAAGNWYFHVCTRDNAGNWSSSATSGPYTVSAPSGSRRLHTLAPCRLFDTRDASGAPPLDGGTDRVFSTMAAPCGVPSTAQALSVNVTVVGPTAPGHLTLYPSGGALPATSTINYGLGQTRANNAILPLGAGAQFAVHCGQVTGIVHLIVDVNGYFE